MFRNHPKSIRKIIFCSLDVIWDLFEPNKGSAIDFQKFGGTSGVPRNHFAARAQKSVLISTYLALLGSYIHQSAQHSLRTLTIGLLSSPNSKMGFYVQIGPVLAEKWTIDGEHK